MGLGCRMTKPTDTKQHRCVVPGDLKREVRDDVRACKRAVRSGRIRDAEQLRLFENYRRIAERAESKHLEPETRAWLRRLVDEVGALLIQRQERLHDRLEARAWAGYACGELGHHSRNYWDRGRGSSGRVGTDLRHDVRA